MDAKLVYIEMRFDNGEAQKLEGGAAQKWFKDVNEKVTFLSVTRNMNMKKHPWKKFKWKK